jgi:hypothetical protein
MLAGAEPGRCRTSPGETADLIGAAVRMRLGQAVSKVTDRRWRDVAAVFAVIAALMLAAEHLRPLVGDASIGRAVGWKDADDWSRIAQASGWLLAACCVRMEWKVAAAVTGWPAVAAEAAWLVSQWPLWQADVVAAWWQWVLAVTCAVTLSVRTERRQGIRLAPSMAMLVLVGWEDGRLLQTRGNTVAQTVVTLLIAPVSVVVSALVMVHWRERRGELLRLGRQAEMAKAAPGCPAGKAP